MQKDITVTKLSKLQKQILVYARKAMIAKGQKIEEPTTVSVCFSAPEWLDRALTEAMSAIFDARKYYQLGETLMYEHHPWIRFFEEMRFLSQTIRDAAKAADIEIKRSVDLLSLYNFTDAQWLSIGAWAHEWKVIIHPWPYYDRGWYFIEEIEGASRDEIMKGLTGLIGDRADTIWIKNRSYPVNCTIPEMLRDIFAFPVEDGGHIDGLAFSVEQIGRNRYNSAQASIRRACDRLAARKLIALRAGQATSPLQFTVYDRAGIGLTEKGVAAADAMAGQPQQQAA